jgi:hypothetical protein
MTSIKGRYSISCPMVFFAELNYDTREEKLTFVFAFATGSADEWLLYYAVFVKLPD